MTQRTSRNIIYSFVNSAIDSAQSHLRSAYDYAFNCKDIDNAIDRCYRAISSFREAEQHVAASRKIISTRQKNKFEDDLVAIHQCLWCLTKDISRQAKSCYIQNEKSRGLRMHFLAYSYEPRDGVESSEADLASPYY